MSSSHPMTITRTSSFGMGVVVGAIVGGIVSGIVSVLGYKHIYKGSNVDHIRGGAESSETKTRSSRKESYERTQGDTYI
jgi:hypothetical protein